MFSLNIQGTHHALRGRRRSPVGSNGRGIRCVRECPGGGQTRWNSAGWLARSGGGERPHASASETG